MQLTERQQNLLRMIPGVDHILERSKKEPYFETIPKSIMVRSVRSVVEGCRNRIMDKESPVMDRELSYESILESVRKTVRDNMSPNLKRVVNATGVVVHTNLGRSLLAADAVCNLTMVAEGYTNLEFDLAKGKRGSRYSSVEDILCEITGAESALVVNNNAGAVFLCLETMAKGKKVIVSRGELVEIGGSFRIPDVMARSGGILSEVGTTNRTHLKDYEDAVDEETALFLKVHKSNYSLVGFTAEVSLKEMVQLGEEQNIPVMEDLGSGSFIDFSRYGMRKEPTVQESVAAGADVVTFSGDKLLGGPQAGIIVGKKDILDQIKKNPINRALRIDKLTLAALESTLRLYRDPDKAVEAIPTLRLLTLPFGYIERKAKHLAKILENIGGALLSVRLVDSNSQVGGGALPLQDLPSKCVAVKIKDLSANAVEKAMREFSPPIIGRIEDDSFFMDLRTLKDDDLPVIEAAFEAILKK